MPHTVGVVVVRVRVLGAVDHSVGRHKDVIVAQAQAHADVESCVKTMQQNICSVSTTRNIHVLKTKTLQSRLQIN